LSGYHSALPEPEELETMAKQLGSSTKDPFTDFEAESPEETYLQVRRSYLVGGIERIIAEVAGRRKSWLEISKNLPWPPEFDISALKFNPLAHTQWMWGQIAAKLDRLRNAEPD